MPKISVIVPTYNCAEFIDDCLTALTKQTLKDIEIICVDNASTDDTVEHIKRFGFADERIKLFVQSENKGQANSLNKGLELATAEYVAECDADDLPEPDMYETLIEHSWNADAVQCGFYYEFPNAVLKRCLIGKEKVLNPLRALHGKNLFNYLLMMPNLMSGMYRKQFLIDNGIKFRENVNFEDTSVTFKIRTSAQRYVLLPKFLYHYRQINDNSGTKTIDDMEAIFEQYAEINRWNNEHGYGLDEEIDTMKYYSYFWASQRAKTEEDAKEFWKRASLEFKNDNANLDYFLKDADRENYLSIKQL